MTVEVGGGIIWKDLLDVLKYEGLTLAAYPSSAPSSTVGGWIATGGTGIGCTKYGGIREQVIDIEIALTDGRVLCTRDAPDDLLNEIFEEAKVDSNDITSLFIGSTGALGIVTKAVLKVIHLRPVRPKVASFSSGTQMYTAIQEIVQETNPYYLHYTNDCFHEMLDELNQAQKTNGDWLLLCAFEGSEEDIDKEITAFNSVVSQYGGFIEDDTIANHKWDERFYPMRIKRLGPSIAPSEVYVPLENLEEFDKHLKKHFKRERYAIEGAVTNKDEAAVLTWFLDDERKRIPFLMGWHRSLDVVKIGLEHEGRAYSVGMWLVGHSKSHFGDDVYSQMKRLKKVTDPMYTLNSNKLFPGSLNLSTRFRLLIMLIAAVAVPAVLYLLEILLPGILQTYLTILDVRNLIGLVTAMGAGFIFGALLSALINRLSVSFMLSIGAPFLRLGRRIWH